jgi:hypothetical protein
MLLAISNGLCLLRAFETSISNASLSFIFRDKKRDTPHQHALPNSVSRL